MDVGLKARSLIHSEMIILEGIQLESDSFFINSRQIFPKQFAPLHLFIIFAIVPQK